MCSRDRTARRLITIHLPSYHDVMRKAGAELKAFPALENERLGQLFLCFTLFLVNYKIRNSNCTKVCSIDHILGHDLARKKKFIASAAFCGTERN